MPITGRSRGRQIRQQLPKPPPHYDETYIARLTDAVNSYMFSAQAPAEVAAARFICVAPVIVDPTGSIAGSIPDTSTLPTGTLYMFLNQAGAAGTPGRFLISIVTKDDTQA